MTLKELKDALNALPPELDGAIVICQKDSEGNGYSPLEGVDENAVYRAAESWFGYVYDLSWTAAEADMNESAWEATKTNLPRCIVLYPIN